MRGSDKLIEPVKIGNSSVGDGQPCFVVAEMGLSHDGSLGAAYAFIDAVAIAGANAVKFQTHIAEKESSKYEQFRKGTFFPQDKSRFNYWIRTGFSKDQWILLKKHAESKNLVFLSSPFCEAAIELLESIGMQAFKISSGEACSRPMIEKILEARLPVILSTGMISISEIRDIVNLARKKKIPVIVCQCTTRYPCPPEHLGLNVIDWLKNEFKVPVGFSDHSGKIFAGLGAFMAGASLIEVHATFSRKCFGPDVSSSLTFEELAELISGIRFLEKCRNNPLDKDKETEKLEPMRGVFAKGIFAKIAISKGEKISRRHICFRKPLMGIPSNEYESILGKKTLRRILLGEYIKPEDIR